MPGNISLEKRIDHKTIEQIRTINNVSIVKTIPAILAVVVHKNCILPFENGDRLRTYCLKHKKQVWEAAIDYEMAVSRWTFDERMKFTNYALRVARLSIKNGLNNKKQFEGLMPLSTQKMLKCFDSKQFILSGILNKAIDYSTAIMEYSNSSEVVPCMPTAGAAGVVSDVITSAAEEMNSNDEQIIKAYLTGGAIGITMSLNNDYCGAEYGCQAEVGCVSSIAAALGSLMNANVDEVLAAASMAMQNILGLFCDPICGLVQVPCFSRNISRISNSIVAANAILMGFHPFVPLDIVFQTMKDSDRYYPKSYMDGVEV